MWDAADAYEDFMGRWSAAVAHRMFDDVAVPRAGGCLDLGCGSAASAVSGAVAPSRPTPVPTCRLGRILRGSTVTALGATVVTGLLQRLGRRQGLTAGYVLGVVG